jgi:hypothetical protein
MNPKEVAEVALAGVDLQLHTHRHRLSIPREHFMREIETIAILSRASLALRPGTFAIPMDVK